MTGTGTQADPYICESWDELLSVSTNKNNYIKMADSDNKTINFNEIQPTGFESQIELSGIIDFNGWTLLNFYSVAQYAFYVKTGSTWKNLNLEKFSHKHTRSDDKRVSFLTTDYDESKITIKGSAFSGVMQYGAGSGISGFLYSANYREISAEECSFNISASSNVAFVVMRGRGFTNSEIIADINADSCNIFTSDVYETFHSRAFNSRFYGKITVSDTSSKIYSGYSDSGFSVYDIRTNVPLKYIGTGISLYNSDLCSASEDSSAVFTAVTSLQMADENYLNSIGFKVGTI